MDNNEQKNFDRTAFLKDVVTEFINKSTDDSRIKLFTGYMTLINNSTNAENWKVNQEKIRIVEQCFELFNNLKFIEYVNNIKSKYNPQLHQLASAITKSISEKVLGNGKTQYDMPNLSSKKQVKRQYDMSKLYSKGQVNSDSLVFRPIVDGLSKSASDASGLKTQITLIGSLNFSVGPISNDSIEKYSISRQISNTESLQYDVYSYIDLNQFEVNKYYRDAVLNELLSKNNIELSNASGYIGSIVDTSNSEHPLSVGEEEKNFFGFYKYQVSKRYALEYDTQDLSAVVEYERKKALASQQKQEQKSDKDQEQNEYLEK